MEPIFYTVTDINGDYAQLLGDQGQEHSITMFLLPEGTTVGSRLKLENFIWNLEAKKTAPPNGGAEIFILTCCCGARCASSRRPG